jgi:hypothetical protein
MTARDVALVLALAVPIAGALVAQNLRVRDEQRRERDDEKRRVAEFLAEHRRDDDDH